MCLRETYFSKGFQCWMQASEHHSKIVENPAESVSLELASEASIFWQPTVLQNLHRERLCGDLLFSAQISRVFCNYCQFFARQGKISRFYMLRVTLQVILDNN